MFEGAALSFFFLPLAIFFLEGVLSELSERPLVVLFFFPFFYGPLFSRGRFATFFFLIVWPQVLT